MKNKLKFLTLFSLKRKIKTKWFIIVNVLLLIAISALVNVDSLIKVFGGDFDKTRTIYVIDNTGFFYETFENTFNNISINLGDDVSNFQVILDNSVTNEKLDEEKDNIILEINKSDNIIDASITSNNYIDLIDLQLITNSINTAKVELAIKNSNISTATLNKIYSEVSIDRIILDEEKSTNEENTNMIMNTIFPVFILPFFMLTIILIQMIGAEVNDEKTTRGMEIIISNVSPQVHFASKVIAGNIFVIGQALLLVIYSLIGIGIRYLIGGTSITNGVVSQVLISTKDVLNNGIGDNLVYILPVTIVLMILTFIAYSLLAGILASMTTNTEDFQQLQTPIVITSMIGYYLAIMANLFKGSIFIKIISYVPLISSILAPSLLILGQINLIDITISFILVILLNYLLIKYGLRIYKVGILNYSSRNLWKKMFKALK